MRKINIISRVLAFKTKDTLNAKTYRRFADFPQHKSDEIKVYF